MGENWLREAGKTTGFRVWRVDNKSQQLSNVPKNSYGVFRSEDCYIALETRIGSTGNFSQMVYQWNGKDSQQQDYTKSKIDELDKSITGDGAVSGFISRNIEKQGQESKQFLSYFPNSKIQYVDPVVLKEQANLRDSYYPTSLYHLKGSRVIRVQLVELSLKSLNSGDVFLLDADLKIFQWNGRSSSRMERAKALDLTVRLRDERMNRCKATIIIIDEGKETDEFWNYLGGKGPIADAKSGGSDEEWEQRALNEHKLYTISEDLWPLTPVETHGRHLNSSMLEEDHSYIADFGTQVFAWTGKNCSNKIKNNALAVAQRFLKENNRPVWSVASKVVHGIEPALFRTHFKGPFSEYIDTPEAHEERLKAASTIAKVNENEVINVDALHHPEKYRLAKESRVAFIPDALLENVTSKEVTLWYIKDKEKHLLPKEEYGLFYTGESYVMVYEVILSNGSKKHVVYYWQGRNSGVDDKGTASLLASDLSQNYGRGCSLVRIPQGKEPDHFLSHFAGFMSVRIGKRTTWNHHDGKAKLYHIRGTTSIDTTAHQVEVKAFSLNSNDVFLLDTPSKVVYVWHGKGANAFEVKAGQTVVSKIVEKGQTKEVKVVSEGSEDSQFWTYLGGKAPYGDSPSLAVGNLQAKLFHCSDRTGVFKVEEVENFTQDDLDPDDVMLLDGQSVVFVWIGIGSTENEKRRGSELAVEYIKTVDDGRAEGCPIYVVDSGSEPLQFTLHFHGWDYVKAKESDDVYSRKLRELNLTTAVVGGLERKTTTTPAKTKSTPIKTGSNITPSQTPKSQSSLGANDPPLTSVNPNNLFFSFERLKVKPLPEGVNGMCLAAFLKPDEFEARFKMTREDFDQLPKWKQLLKKKEVGLF